MNIRKSSCLLAVMAASLVVAGCFHRGPVAQKTASLKSEGEKLRAEGDKDVKHGVDLQNKAKELRVVAEENQRQANEVSANDPTRADTLRQQSMSQLKDANDLEQRGRDQEAHGRDLQRQADGFIERSQHLKDAGERIEPKTVD